MSALDLNLIVLDFSLLKIVLFKLQVLDKQVKALGLVLQLKIHQEVALVPVLVTQLPMIQHLEVLEDQEATLVNQQAKNVLQLKMDRLKINRRATMNV